MNAIIIAAGSGKRISNEVKDIPKSMVKVNEKSIIEHQISVLKQAEIDEIYVITGPHSEKFDLNHVKYIKDQNYTEHDILGSLMEAKNFLKNDILVLYSDIIFDLPIIQQMLDSKDDISIAIDMNWEKMYEGRTLHPKSEAENVELNYAKKIIKIQKNIQNNNNCIGEFLGIVKFSPTGSKLFVKKYEELAKTHIGNFQQADSISKAYLTDMIQELIDSNIHVEPIFISGKWCEIDTIQDLRNAEKIFKN
ncbi:sugar nucleotidyltransferase [Nitrosopumilus zosterae]|uniref:Sugar nucleotidyltransferase n=1 Tax=Nitrosopumilus zosterae TaxID=718286 RepID=A0A2S2KU16_9ARCH|nr:phosphocholine cytidylyltransferase family protein [Nitrosopumilus zosterae]BDQ31794.1 phosphocholine cytidylyltransferase family protein [Nitrosopumilus zosterae]GBH35144.1 sugar nucleotidyltransferase [Nitrosopumilus zosterae]